MAGLAPPAFVTDRDGDKTFLDADHRHHAVQELAIRDLKEGAALNQCPSGAFFANAAWLVLATLAHNLLRWTAHLGALTTGPVVAKTIRRRFLTLPGRLTRTARIWTLHLPTRWPWRDAFLTAPQQTSSAARALLTGPRFPTLRPALASPCPAPPQAAHD